MLVNRNEDDSTDDKVMAEAYRNHIASVRIMARKKPNWRMIEIRYDESVNNPGAIAHQVNHFLGGRYDEAKMLAAVDKNLYRNRKDKLAGKRRVARSSSVTRDAVRIEAPGSLSRSRTTPLPLDAAPGVPGVAHRTLRTRILTRVFDWCYTTCQYQ